MRGEGNTISGAVKPLGPPRQSLGVHRVRLTDPLYRAPVNLKARASALAFAIAAMAPRLAHADEDKPPPQDVSGIARPEQRRSDRARSVANTALWVPRWLAGLLFETGGAAAGIIENEQVVPRVRDLLFARDGSIKVFPTVFAETGMSPNVGARMIASGDNEATSLRAGYGGPDANVVEGRMRFARAKPWPMVLSMEALHDRRSHLGYGGMGQKPESDPRNHFISDLRSVSYRERRERVIASVGMRPSPDVEVFVSSSYAQRFADEIPEERATSFDAVYEPGSVPGALRTTRLVYTELAVRLDTREVRAAPEPGLVVEGYAGSSRGVLSEHGRFLRLGGRAAGFVSLYRRTNVLSPKLVIDGVASPSGELVPFNELARQPDFRGFNSRRDYTSMVASLDYRWKLANYLAATVFIDGATVAPSVKELKPKDMRWAGGAGVDLYSDNALLARLFLVVSPEGAMLQLSFGVASRFGDRQHRN
jgi:hypothetical protein